MKNAIDPNDREFFVKMLMDDGMTRKQAEAKFDDADRQLREAIESGKLKMGKDGLLDSGEVMRVFPAKKT